MKRWIWTACLGAVLCTGCNHQTSHKQAERPKLVVGIVVDQMRWDYLYRYYDRYDDGGFKRMLREGFSCNNTQINYLPTITAVGHTSIYTGTVPAIHGIAGNSFLMQDRERPVYCTDDPTVTSVGTDAHAAGSMSPHNLLVSTLTDELRLATNFRSKTIGIALKDRAAILPAGHTANAAYWFDSKTGRWITSSYYMNQLPQWVDDLNAQKPAVKLLEKGWQPLYPIQTYTQSTADSTRYEQPFEKGTAPTLPVDTKRLLIQKGYGVIRNTPMGNTLTLDMAKATIKHEQLGQDDITDFLTVSLSSTDHIGHQFGVNSVETEDTYLRLDKDLADFMTYLDRQIGKGNYLLFLTADHAAAHNIRFMQDNRLPADTWQSDVVRAELDSLISTRLGVQKAIQHLMNYQVYLNRRQIASAQADYEQVKALVIEYLQAHRGVAYAIDLQQAAASSVPLPLRERVINGYNPQRSGDIQLVLQPGWYEVPSTQEPLGSTHAVWYAYDAHIPLIFTGWGVSQGQTNRETHITDIAATVAAMLHIQMPSGCIGSPIGEVMKQQE